MVTSNELFREFESATNEFIGVASSFSQASINTPPFVGSWTAAQVTEHVFKSDNGMLKTLYGPVQPTNRQPDEKIPELRALFLDFTTKLKSPDFIIPSDEMHDRDSLITAFKSVRDLLGKAIKTLDLTATCYLPIFGEPTRMELITFVIVHTQRHTHQLKDIYQRLLVRA